MKYYRLTTIDPYYNLALEEYLFTEGDEDVIMLWQNEPSVVVGVNQNIRAEVDMSALLSRGVHPVRRITGGGAVYHDAGNINYTFIGRNEGGIDFRKFSAPIIEALASLGVTLTLSGRNDLCLEDGRKVSGGAEASRGGRVLHHGTLLFNADMDALGEILTPSPEKLATKAIKSTRSRVANLVELLPDIRSAEELMNKIEEYVITTLGASREEIPTDKRIDDLRARNASDEWLYPARGISSEVTITKRGRFASGTVTAEFSIIGDKIKDIKFSGDFFSEMPIEALEQSLRGISLSSLENSVSEDLLAASIKGMSVGDLTSLLN